MKDGKCPKCNATTVYSKRKGIKFGNGGVYVDISSEWISKSVKEVDCYICISCGYFENYLVDPDRLHAITRDWEKVD
jgi:hypothetical protein